MERSEIYTTLTQLLGDVLGNRSVEIGPDTMAEDVEGWDSFNHLNVIVAVETRFGIRIGTRDLDKLQTVGDLVQIIWKQTH